jgi:hypothetical protein
MDQCIAHDDLAIITENTTTLTDPLHFKLLLANSAVNCLASSLVIAIFTAMYDL